MDIDISISKTAGTPGQNIGFSGGELWSIELSASGSYLVLARGSTYSLALVLPRDRRPHKHKDLTNKA